MKWLGMKCLLLPPLALGLAACEVGHVKMPMAPMTLAPSEATDASCTDATTAACRPRATLQKGQ